MEPGKGNRRRARVAGAGTGGRRRMMSHRKAGHSPEGLVGQRLGFHLHPKSPGELLKGVNYLGRSLSWQGEEGDGGGRRGS